MRRPSLDLPPVTPREACARRLLERVLAGATALVLVAGAVERAGAPSPSPPLRSLPVDLANDPPWRLSLLPGIGRGRAEALLRDREAHGPVRSLDELDRVPGIGRRTIAALSVAGAVVGPPGGSLGPRAPPASPRAAEDAGR